jgi:hypothetical protein
VGQDPIGGRAIAGGRAVRVAAGDSGVGGGLVRVEDGVVLLVAVPGAR